MPIYEYQPSDPKHTCAHCRHGFEALRRLAAPPLTQCPACNAPVQKCISAPTIGASKSGFNDRAKAAGFHKLKKVSKGEYEKEY